MGYSQKDEVMLMAKQLLSQAMVNGKKTGNKIKFVPSKHECPYCKNVFEGVPKFCPHCKKTCDQARNNRIDC